MSASTVVAVFAIVVFLAQAYPSRCRDASAQARKWPLSM
jgi:hypothetical protein